jgi:predicted acyltransferase
MAGERWDALDDLRGIAVLVMVPVNVAAAFTSIPSWFMHAPAEGLTIADLVVPLFLSSLGLSASFSFKARLARGGFGRTFLHTLIRYSVLFAFGTIGIVLMDPGHGTAFALNAYSRIPWHFGGHGIPWHSSAGWEVLQMLGATGLFSFFFLLLPPWPRLGAAALLLAGVEALRPAGLGVLMRGWYATGLAGPWGTFSLSFFAISASALGELVKEAKSGTRLLASGLMAAAMAVSGGIALLFFPPSKHLLSLSYILLGGAVSSALLAVLIVWREKLRWPLPLVGSLGRNPLLLYMLHAVLGVALHALVPDNVTAWEAWTASFAVLAACAAAAIVLDRRKIFVKL